MKTTLKILSLGLLSFTLFGARHAQASTLSQKEIKCHTQNGEKVFTLSEKFLTFQDHSENNSFLPKRIISSSNAVRTKVQGSGIVQTLNYEGNNHKVVIKDLKGMNELSDYLSITSPKGHEMTYPITCSYVE
ncbi:MAG: hypothetical protein ACOYL6_13565 [Bacteriovoracaceae bacterium]